MEKLPSIIPSIWTIGQRDAASLSAHSLVHVAGAKLGSITEFVQPLQMAGKRLWVHVDMIAGLKMDREGMSVVATLVEPAAIVTSNVTMARMARDMNKSVVLRVFIHDTQSLDSSLAAIERVRPNIVCCLPSMVFPFVSRELVALRIPLVAAGLVRSAAHRDSLIKLGVSVEIGNIHLW